MTGCRSRARLTSIASRWHSGVGGGVWLALVLGVSTFELSTAVTATIVRSGEGTSFYFASGFGF